jgi:hypothetical protein
LVVGIQACGGSKTEATGSANTTSSSSGAGGEIGTGGAVAGTGGTSAISSSSSTGAGTGGAMGTGGFTAAMHPALPQVENLGGIVLKKPMVQPIRYMSDPMASDLDAFLQELSTTTTWSAQTSEYGVGPLDVLPAIIITTAAPAMTTDADLQQELANNLQGASPAWGAANTSTIYLFELPPGTIESDPTGSCCTDFDGYHGEAQVGTANVPYAVSCACHGYDGPTITDLQQRTVNISHELAEAATDPFPNSDPAYGQTDNADILWTIVTGGEVADMCEFNNDAYAIPAGSKYMVQRSWSNKAAKASTNPCVPVPAAYAPFFDASVAGPDMLSVKGTGVLTPGIKLAVGQSTTVPVTLFSDAPEKTPWKVSVIDANYANGGAARLQLTLNKTTGTNGTVLNLTIKVLSADPQFGVEGFVLFSDLGAEENLWMGTVGQQ